MVQNSGIRSRQKLTRNETRNSYHLILKGACCAINPFEHVLVQRGQKPLFFPLSNDRCAGLLRVVSMADKLKKKIVTIQCLVKMFHRQFHCLLVQIGP